ncbi:Quinohemoprotein amine dehydrogenase subunit alpha [Candidatus Terasakiella magnetica]|nr:Quinohemoprotein amine dehydrogenase subunit alpha [Candidatus Terasakiella magnetica]
MKRMSLGLRFAAWASLALAALMPAHEAHAAEPSGPALLNAKCSTCHARSETGALFRIDAQRKTPEGWMMTIDRMQKWHGVILTEAEEATLIKHLADTRGLAPEEAAPFRYAVERRTLVETPDDSDLAAMCARCHSYARVGLQRRAEGEWRRLAHMHLGQWPTLEYQSLSRDRKWWELASGELPGKLAAKWPLVSEAWTAWQRHPTASLAGRWRVAGHRPGKGDYQGVLTIGRGNGEDRYSLDYQLTWADGTVERASGGAVLYTGYEWRGAVTLGNERVSEVLRLSPDGTRLHGRWFVDGQDAIGADMVAVRGKAVIAALSPAYLKAGETRRITIAGSGLGGTVSLGADVRIDKIETATAETVTVIASAQAKAKPGLRDVAVGTAKASGALAVYDAVSSVRVEPETMLARLGGGGAPVPVAPAQFEAVAYMAAPEGEIRIGPMPAKWSAAGFDETAIHDEDARFGGVVSASGLFTPAEAGPNSKRNGNNNVANLLIKAEIGDGARVVEGKAHLIVAPQRWNDAAIR